VFTPAGSRTDGPYPLHIDDAVGVRVQSGMSMKNGAYRSGRPEESRAGRTAVSCGLGQSSSESVSSVERFRVLGRLSL
jgi:hypothetical protein